MRRARLALLVVCTMFFAGCLGPDTAEWGSSGIEVDIDRNPATEASITTNLGSSKSTYENLSPVGCDVGDEVVTAKNASDRIKFTGYLSASVFYGSHEPNSGAKGMDTAVTAAVAIQAMPISDAKSVKDGEGARIDVKQWDVPLMPETRAGTVDLDEIDSETESDWYVLGLIPTTENLNDGFRSLSEWHKPITIHGYLISTTTVNGSVLTIDGNSQSSANGYHRPTGISAHTVDDNCNLNVGTNNLQSVYVLVDKIEIDDRVVSSNGNADDEWKLGHVPFIGRGGFVTFFIVVGIGGSVGMFLLSQMIVRQGAKETMKTLLGEEGLAKIKKVAADLRRDKKSGTLSPTERKRQYDRADRRQENQKTKQSAKNEDTGISGFDLDSALSGGSSNRPSEFGDSSASVVITEESKKMEQKMSNSEVVSSPTFGQQDTWSPPQKRESTPVSNVSSSEPAPKRTKHFSGVRQESSPKPKSAKAPIKRRAAKKRQSAEGTPKEVEPEYEAKSTPQTFDDDEDFSDFSF